MGRRQRQNSNSIERYENTSNNRKLEVDKAQHSNTKKDIDLWELHHGNKSIKKSSEDLTDRFDKNLSNQNVPLHQSQSVLIKTTSDTDYHEIKQKYRDTSSFLALNGEMFIEFPVKFMKETSSGMTWSCNLEMSRAVELEVRKNAQIRKSIDTMVNELENETMRKRSRENSLQSGLSESSKRKKKKREINWMIQARIKRKRRKKYPK